MFCNQCGGRIADGSVFCNLCGARQGVVVSPGAPQGAPAPGMPPQAAPVAQYAPAPQQPAAAPPPMPQSLKCNSCGASLQPPSGSAVVVCEYCGAATQMAAATGQAQVIQKHYMLNNTLNNESATHAGGQWLNKGLFRRKVAERSELGQIVLKYVPYWIVPTTMVADFSGTKNVSESVMRNGQWTSVTKQVPVHDRVQLQQNIPVVAVRGYTQYQPKEGFQFQLQGKGNFDKRAPGGLEGQTGDVSEAEAKGTAGTFAQDLAQQAARKRVDNLQSFNGNPQTFDGELVHIPVWFMQYTHKGKQMFILIDGSTGQVINGERPAFSLW